MCYQTWKQIQGFPNYEISDEGNVRNKKGKILKKFISNGYNIVFLKIGRAKTTFKIHKLVAEYFIPNNNLENCYIDHINGIKTDNRVANLRWCTYKQNIDFHHKNNINRGICLTRWNTFSSQIQLNGRKIQKTFKTFNEAVEHYKLNHRLSYGVECTSIYDESLISGNLPNNKIPIEQLVIEKSKRVLSKWTVKLGKQYFNRSRLKYLGFDPDWDYVTACTFLSNLKENKKETL